MALARERDDATEHALTGLLIEGPSRLLRDLRTYLSRQADQGRIRKTNEKIPRLETGAAGLNQLTCDELRFCSGARLDFKIHLETYQAGWAIKRFQFHIQLPHARSIRMVRVHLNIQGWHDPLSVPRCHLHIDNSQAHVPFPIMNPLLVLHLMCEHIEADFGT